MSAVPEIRKGRGQPVTGSLTVEEMASFRRHVMETFNLLLGEGKLR